MMTYPHPIDQRGPENGSETLHIFKQRIMRAYYLQQEARQMNHHARILDHGPLPMHPLTHLI
jgi:hypothetical protein